MMQILQGMKRATGQYMAGFAMLLLISIGAATPAGALIPPLPVLVVIINVTVNAPDVLNGTDGQCSLREAITNINNGATTFSDCAPSSPAATYGLADKINLPAGTYTTAIVNPAAAEEDLNANGDLDIRKAVTIVGAGAATTTINANGFLTSDRVLDINPQGTVGVAVSISGVTMKNGATLFDGGGIRNQGTLTITNSTISKNSAQFSGNPQNGGGIWNRGTLSVTRSTISGNIAHSGGGGIFTTSTGLVRITNSTISGNTATTVEGGGIDVLAGSLTITNSTISGNAAGSVSPGGSTGSGSGIMNFSVATITNSTITGNTNEGINNNTGGTLSLKNTIVANQGFGADCLSFGGTILTLLNNVVGSGNCGVVPTSNPLLGPLANYGGPTKTHALLPGSPAIAAGDATTCTTLPVNSLDQRGIVRPQGAGCDIGAFELGPLPVVGLSLNRSSFVTGNTMILTASTTPGSTPTHADVYVAKQLPDGTLLIMQPDGTFSTARTALLSNILVPSFNGPIITSTFTGAEAVGNYTWFAAFMQPGTMNIIGTLATVPFTFGP